MSDTSTASSPTNPTFPVEMDYTLRDFESIRTFLVSAARGYIPEWISVGEPADFGGMAVYLASDASSFHTGDSFLIDGGYAIF